jgi:hypothetical protein
VAFGQHKTSPRVIHLENAALLMDVGLTLAHLYCDIKKATTEIS